MNLKQLKFLSLFEAQVFFRIPAEAEIQWVL
jgi:hypothetical protein